MSGFFVWLKSFVKRRKKLVIIGTILVLAIIVIPRIIASKKNKNLEKTQVQKGEVKEELILSGEIVADEDAKLGFQSSGKIAYVGVKEGQKVVKGTLLAKLDTTTLNSALQQARSSLRSAEATVERVHDDVKDHSSDETFTQKETRTAAEVAKDNAYEAVVAAEEALRNATLYAPFSGIVTYVANPYPGVNVLYSQTQVEVVNPETIHFEVTADQTEVYSLKEGMSVEIVLDAFEEKSLKGKISNISITPKEGEVGIVYKVRIAFDENSVNDQLYRIGMTGDAKFVLSQKDDVLYVPPKFISSDSNGKYVKKGKKNSKTYIDLGIEGEDRVEISGDINEGDEIFE